MKTPPARRDVESPKKALPFGFKPIESLLMTGLVFSLAVLPAQGDERRGFKGIIHGMNALASGFAGGVDDANVEIIGKYLDATRAQQTALRGIHMEADLSARLPKLEKQASLQALRSISNIGEITFKVLGFSGDDTVKREVIARYLTAEREPRDTRAIAITPANYKFRLIAPNEPELQRMYKFELTPRKKRAGLFKGELWIDAETGMPIRESGQFVKNPSVFLKRIRFVREYEICDGVALPRHIEITVDTRIVGRAELSIQFSNFAGQDGGECDSRDSGTRSGARKGSVRNAN